jgi:WD40 repeat protein
MRLHRPSSPTPLTDPITGQELRRFEGEGSANCLAFSPDGKVVAGCIQSGPKASITLWEAASGRALRSMGGSFPGTLALVFSPDDNVLFSCVSWIQDERPNPCPPRVGTRQPSLPDESSIQLWDVAAAKEIRRIGLGKTRINQAVLAPDGKTVATSATDKTIRLWDLPTGRELRRFGGSDAETGHIAFSPDGTKLASSESRGNNFDDIGQDISKVPPLTTPVHVWDTATGKRRADKVRSPIGPALIKAFRFAPDGKSVATIGGNWVRIWDVATGKETRRIALPNKGPNTGFTTIGARLAFSPDGTTLAATNERDGLIFLLDVASGRELGRVDGPDDYKALAFSPDGKLLATDVDISKGLPDHELSVRLWDVTARKEIGRVPAHRNSIRALAFSPDGKRLLSASEDATALVWDVAALTGHGIAGPPPTSLSSAGTAPVSR